MLFEPERRVIFVKYAALITEADQEMVPLHFEVPLPSNSSNETSPWKNEVHTVSKQTVSECKLEIPNSPSSTELAPSEYICVHT